MTRITTIAATVLLATCAAWADKVVTDTQIYDNVKVFDFSAKTLRFMDGKTVRKVAMKDLVQITLEKQDLFNQAEQLRADGKYSEATARYAQAAKKAVGQWRFLLFKARGEQTSKMGGGATSKPSDDEPKAPSLSSLDALGADLATEPVSPKDRQSWAGLNETDRKDALEKYEKDLADWKKSHDYHGAKVSWVLKVVEVQEGEGGAVTITCKSDKGFTLTASCKLDAEVKKAVEAKKPVAVVGTIKEYKIDLSSRTDSFFDTSITPLDLTLGDAQLYLPEKAPKIPTSQPATSRPAGK